MNQVISQTKLQQCCVKLTCGSDQGTAFFISKNLLITAYHVVLEYDDNTAPITFNADGKTASCKIRASSKDFDICILESDVDNGIWLPLLSSAIRAAEHCELAGFPYKQESTFSIYHGAVGQLIVNERTDFKISAAELDKNFDYEGLSGGPIITANKITGVALKQVDNSIAAISIKKIKPFLIEQHIEVEDEYLYYEVPKEFRESIKNTSPNYKAIEAINETLSKSGNWIMMQGTPGSGKSTIAASFNPSDKNVVILGRYFLKVPNDSKPAAVRTSPQFFFETIENLLAGVLTGEPLSKKEITFEKRHERFINLIRDVNAYFESKSQIGVLIIDGIDEAPDIESFLSPLPIVLGNNLKIVISCTSQAKIPSRISVLLNDDNIVTVTRLEMGQCEALIRTELQTLNLPIEAIQKLALKSEGHPLYLRYLINFAKANNPDKPEEFDQWIDSMPVISGDITKYYEAIWASINADANKLWMLILLSNLRQSVDKDTLYALLPDQLQLNFTATYPSIAFLLADERGIEVYHNSFKEFVLSKTAIDERRANDIIAGYCDKFPDTELARNNIVFHLSKGSNPLAAVTACSQEWADICANGDVAPDLVINDIKLCLSLSLHSKKTTDVIRLLLLLQRISFRYDNVFKENATYLAQALVSFGRYESALKYLVRDNTLLVSNNDAIFFLQQFYEAGANEQASILLAAIDRKYRKVLQESFESEEGLDPSILILKLNSLVLYMNDDYLMAGRQWLYFRGKYKQINEMAGKESPVQGIREHCAAWQAAYIIRQFDTYNDYRKVAKVTKIKTTVQLSKILATAAIIFDELNTYNSYIVDKGATFQELIVDLEDLIENIGYENTPRGLFVLAKALIINSKNTALTEKILREYLAIPFNLQMRKDNGVDLNYSSVHTLLFRSSCEGYVDTSNGYPPIAHTSPRFKHWEDYVISITKLLGFIEGKMLRLQAGGTANGKSEVDKKLDTVIKGIKITLDERSYWENSYHLPEGLFPLLTAKLVDIVNQHSQDRLPAILKLLSEIPTNQFGVYTEGFRSCLFEAVASCVRHGVDKPEFLSLMKLWHDHVLQVENRWERTQELLKISEIYGLINEADLAHKSFQDMLNTSMGPTWYKESQLALINQSLRLRSRAETTAKYLQRFAGILDFASGEMTFQRYVRNEKEGFVGSLSRERNLATGIEYFKFEVMPPPDVLITNAESRTIDAPRTGDGYALGAANITEPAAIRSIIRQGKSPYIRWFLSYVYVVNDDTFRYAQDFAEIHAGCLNELQNDAKFLKEASRLLNSLIESDEIQEGRNFYEYIKPLYLTANETIKQWLRDNIKAEVEWDKLGSIDEGLSTKEPNFFNVFNSEFKSGKMDRDEAISMGFSTFNKERVNIWYSNWSTASDETRRILRETLKSPGEALAHLAPFIEEYSDEYWHMAAQILWFVRATMPEEQKANVQELIADHFQIIVRPDEATIEKYSWLNNENERASEDPDCLLIDLLIWLLNHPSERLHDKARFALAELVATETEKIVSGLVTEIVRNQPRRSTEHCAMLLKDIAGKYPQELIKHIKADVIDQLKQVNHFTIKKIVLDLGIELNKHGFKLLYDTIIQTIPENVVLVGDVAFEEDELEPIQHYIDELNDEQLLNRAFCENLMKMIKDSCGKLSPAEFEKSDRYLNRSFYVESETGRYSYLLKHCLNVAITPRIQRSKYGEVFELLN